MKSGGSIFLTIILVISTSFNFPSEKANEPILSTYQLDVISYFKEVALGFEYGNATGITRKWKTPMKILVMGNPTPAINAELYKVASELNILFSDGFQIEFTDTKENSNFTIFFGSKNEFTNLYPADSHNVANSTGLFHIFWNLDSQITRGYIFIHTHNISEQEQRHTIREELTQALGLGKDSPKYMESIFQSSWTTTSEYAAIDKDLVRLLYHPDMEVGKDSQSAEEALRQILASERVALN